MIATRPATGETGLLIDHLRARADEVRGLTPLSSAAAGELVERRIVGIQPILRDRCVQLSGGNPLYLLELVRRSRTSPC